MKKLAICLFTLACAGCGGAKAPKLPKLPSAIADTGVCDAEQQNFEEFCGTWRGYDSVGCQIALDARSICLKNFRDSEAKQNDDGKTWACAEGHSCR